LGTFSISLVTYWIILFLSKFMLIYGKRRLVLSLLIGFFIGFCFGNLFLSAEQKSNQQEYQYHSKYDYLVHFILLLPECGLYLFQIHKAERLPTRI